MPRPKCRTRYRAMSRPAQPWLPETPVPAGVAADPGSSTPPLMAERKQRAHGKRRARTRSNERGPTTVGEAGPAGLSRRSTCGGGPGRRDQPDGWWGGDGGRPTGSRGDTARHTDARAPGHRGSATIDHDHDHGRHLNHGAAAEPGVRVGRCRTSVDGGHAGVAVPHGGAGGGRSTAARSCADARVIGWVDSATRTRGAGAVDAQQRSIAVRRGTPHDGQLPSQRGRRVGPSHGRPQCAAAQPLLRQPDRCVFR